MKVIYSDHAKKRLRQRGITSLEVEFVLNHPKYIKKSFDGRKIAAGIVNNRNIKVVFTERKNYITVITII